MPTRKISPERILDTALKKLEATETPRQIEILADRLVTLAKEIEWLRGELADTHKEVTEIRDYANKWKGGFYALAGVGAGITAIVAFWDRVRMLWTH